MTKYIGITGSVGKSTTIGILSVLLRNRGFSVHEVHKQDEIKVGLEKADVDFVLIKFSPFVLENFKDLSLDISAILNIRTELKDKDISESNFVKLFGQIYNNTKEFCIFNARDRSTDRLVQDADVVEGARAIGFTRSTPSRGQIGLVEGIVVDRAFYDDPTDPLRFLNATEILNLKDYKNLLNAVDVLPDYLVENVVAAITIARSLGVSVESISGSLHQFILNNTQNHLAYRRDLSVEPQYLSGAVNYVNDLNSQNPVSTLEVLKSYRKNSVILVPPNLH
ncbi:hypothetical protein FACS1894125_6850 [Actinomycetota bacterium]|nr:hypothetical protein FACS1894125_6850 [Actinomycetota bacterium]